MELGPLLFSLKGRINRAEWWAATILIILLLFGVGTALMWTFVGELTADGLSDGRLFRQTALASLVMNLIVAWPLLALNVKRLHDRDIPAWPAMVFSALQLLGPMLKAAAAFGLSIGAPTLGLFGGLAMQGFGLATLAFSIGMLVVLGFLPGWPGANLYGPPPGASEPART